MYNNLLAASAVLVTLATVRTTLLPAESRTSTTLEKRYTPPPGASGSFICKDYFDDCGNTYGPGCFTSFPHSPEPTFTTPVCNVDTTVTSLYSATTTPAPAYVFTTTVVVDGVTETLVEPAKRTAPEGTVICKDYFDDCGNTYGPGCFTSIAGQADPTFTTPYCEAKATSTMA